MNSNQITFSYNKGKNDGMFFSVSCVINETIQINNRIYFEKELYLYCFKKNDKKVLKEELLNIDWGNDWEIYCLISENNATLSCIKYAFSTNTIRMNIIPNDVCGSSFIISAHESIRENIQKAICELIHSFTDNDEGEDEDDGAALEDDDDEKK